MLSARLHVAFSPTSVRFSQPTKSRYKVLGSGLGLDVRCLEELKIYDIQGFFSEVSG